MPCNDHEWSHEEGTMKRVGVREFRDHATKYLAGDEALTIERNGEPIGIYIPTAPSSRQRKVEAMARLEAAVQRLLDATGMTEEELGDYFDLSKPLPEESEHASVQMTG